MSNVIQEIIFPGSGMDTDSDERFIGQGDSPYRLNILVSEDNAIGVITNMKGNTQTIDISDHLLSLSHTYVTIGSYYNRLTRKCYYWVFSQPYDSGGGVYIYDNRLFCYNEDTFDLDLIFIDTKNYFGLDVDYPFKDSSMLGDWLYFNPRVSEPKVIDVVRAYNYTNYDAYNPTSTYIYGDKVTYNGGLFLANTSVGVGQTPATNVSKWDRIGDSYKNYTDLDFDSEFYYAFNVIKMPPYERPRLVYGNDTSINSNNVRGKIFRFSYRYRYFDNSYSVYSAYSDISLPENDEVWNGEVLNAVTDNNYIEVTVYLHSPALVKELEVVFQDTSGNWKRAKVINRQSQDMLETFSTSFKFYNNESYITVVNLNVERIQDYVPREANSQEIINKNILTYGGCLEGFDNIDKDDIRVGLTPVLTAIETSALPGATVKDVYAALAPRLITKVYNLTTTPVTIGMQVDIGSWYLDGLNDGQQLIVTIDGKTSTHVFPATSTEVTTSKANFVFVVTQFLMANYAGYNINNSTGGNYVVLWSPLGSVTFANITQFLFCTVGAVDPSLTKKRGFKTGANHPFCIYYYDDNLRRWDAQVSKENIHIFGTEMHGTTVYVPMFNEYPHPIVNTTAYRWVIDWEVYHLPPAGAKYWRWGCAGNSLCSYMVQYIVSSVATDGAMTKIDITPLQTLKSTVTATWNQYPNSIIDPYAWQTGDRVRFITTASAPGAGTTLGEPVDGVYDYEIIKQDGTNSEFIYTQYFNYLAVGAGFGVNTLIEIYRPIKDIADTKLIYYEFGDLMPIIEDSAGVMVHAGQSGLHNQDTALSHAALGTFDNGDIYHIMRAPSKPLDTVATTKMVFHESMWYSDFYDSDDYDRGKIGIESNYGERFLNIIRYSRPYFQNTQINGLPTFEEDPGNWPGYKELNDVFGDIVSIYEQGDTLKVYQERKASSIFIGRTEYMDSTGATQVAISTAVLGAIRYSPSNFSTIFPESISRNNKFIYGFDIYNGVVFRDSVNGIFPISGRWAEAGTDSDYKMQTYFKLKAKALMESGSANVQVLSVWDEEYKNLYFTFKDFVNDDNNETIVFHEPSNRWICFASFDQTSIGGYNSPLVPSPYTIETGFENGIGYSFNEETGFGHFDLGSGLGTTTNVNVTSLELPIVLSVNPPTVSADTSLSVSYVQMVLSVNTATKSTTSLSVSVNSMSWTAPQYGIGNQKTTQFTLVGSDYASLTSFPTWITVVDYPYYHGSLSVGYTLYNNNQIGIYPTTANTGVARSGNVVWTDNYGNVATIAVSQDANLINPTLNIFAGDDSTMPIYDTSGIVTVGDATLQITFTPNHVLYNYLDHFNSAYEIYRNGVLDSTGSLLVLRDETPNTRSIEMTSVAVNGETIYVYIGLIV